MRHPLLLLLPMALAASRSLALGIQSSSVRPMMPAETESQGLLIIIFCLIGLLMTLSFMIMFPNFGAVIAEYNQF
jgi:hypothetical protein